MELEMLQTTRLTHDTLS